MPVVSANGLDIFYEARGHGEAILLIAGFGCDLSIWSQVVPHLSSGHRVIVFDNRGMGRTVAPDGPSSIRQMASDTAALIAALGLGRVHVAGHSMGGMIAQELALQYPEVIASLMLLSTCAGLDERGRAIIRAWGELPRLLDVRTTTRLIMPWIYTNAFYERPGAVEQVQKALVTNPYPPTPQAVQAQSQAIVEWESYSRLSAINHPTLVLVGREDILLPVAFAESLAQGIRGAELLVLQNTGHGIPVESPAQLAEAMRNWLAQQQQTQGGKATGVE
jgi:pimeloyl-ACP methyl ester carboxylesterase